MDNKSKNSHLLSLRSSNQISSTHPKWLSENVEGVNHSIKRMLEIIEQVEDSSAEKTEIFVQKRAELIALIEEINHKHQFLAERYDHLAEELHDNFSSALQVQKPGSPVFHTCQDNSFLTPDQKLGMNKIERQAIAFDFPLSSSGSSSNMSAREGSESLLLLSSDSDSESYNSSDNNHSNSKSRNCREILTKLETANDILKVRENLEYGRGKKTSEYEEELRILKQNLRSSEDEIARLKSELKSKTSVSMDNLKTELKRAMDKLEVCEDDLEVEKRKGSELQMQVAALEAKVADSGCKIENLVKELKITTEKLDISEGELAKLKQNITNEICQSTFQLQTELELTKEDAVSLNANLASEKMRILELEERITRYTTDVSDRDCEIRKLTTALQEALRNSEVEKAQLQSHNSSLVEKLTLLEARCAEREVQIKFLETEIKQCEASNLEMKALHEAQEMRWLGDIEGLTAQLNENGEKVESLNKSCDGLKLKYDMLMAEKDGLIAKVQTLKAELCSRDNRIQQLEAELCQLTLQHVEISALSESAFKLRDNLRLKVEELKKEVEKQAAMISDRAEEKREAIRQLCFSLEHYRSEYHELREAYIGQRRHAVIAS